jgi:hypothetical protein
MPEKESQSEKDFPDWNSLFSNQKIETTPWYNEQLDSDLEEELERRKVSKGRILDLGNKVVFPDRHYENNLNDRHIR